MYRLFALLCMFSSFCRGSELGNYGQVFDVQEVDIRTVISSRLNTLEDSGELKKIQENIKRKTVNEVIRPNATIVQHRTKTEIHYVDPSVVLNSDIYSNTGRLIARKGTTINPFRRVKLSKVLVFLNFDDKKQVNYARMLKNKYFNIKYVLTSGNMKDAQDTFGRVYFDMHSDLSSKLNITHVPAIAEQSGLMWKVTEVGDYDE